MSKCQAVCTHWERETSHGHRFRNVSSYGLWGSTHRYTERLQPVGRVKSAARSEQGWADAIWTHACDQSALEMPFGRRTCPRQAARGFCQSDFSVLAPDLQPPKKGMQSVLLGAAKLGGRAVVRQPRGTVARCPRARHRAPACSPCRVPTKSQRNAL